jgi:hypothetical protein
LVFAFLELFEEHKNHKNLFSIDKMIFQLKHSKLGIETFWFFHTSNVKEHLSFKHNKVILSLAIVVRVMLSLSPGMKVSFIFAN